MAGIILKSEKVNMEYNIPSRQTIMVEIPDALYFTMRQIHTSKLLTKSEVFVLLGSGYGYKVNNNPLMNAIVDGTRHTVSVSDTFYCTAHMKGVNTNNYKFISNCMKGMMDYLYQGEGLFNLINFDGAKVVQASGQLLEVDLKNLTCML